MMKNKRLWSRIYRPYIRISYHICKIQTIYLDGSSGASYHAANTYMIARAWDRHRLKPTYIHTNIPSAGTFECRSLINSWVKTLSTWYRKRLPGRGIVPSAGEKAEPRHQIGLGTGRYLYIFALWPEPVSKLWSWYMENGDDEKGVPSW